MNREKITNAIKAFAKASGGRLARATSAFGARLRPLAGRAVASARPLARRVANRWKTSPWPGKARQYAQARFARFQPLLKQIAERAGTTIGQARRNTEAAQNLAFYGNVATVVLSTYFLADVTAILAGKLIPEAPPSLHAGRFLKKQDRARSLDEYSVIFTRNLFNSRGVIPGEESVPGQTQDLGGAPIKTTLPIDLVGTMILQDESRSIATIEDKGTGLAYPVRVSDEIPTKLRVLKIEPRRVVFLNLASSRREYVDLPPDFTPIHGATVTAHSGGAGVERVSSNQFNIARSEVDKTLADFNQVLTQARAVPNFENGVPAGYKLFQIVPGSIYDKLGLQNGDVITGLNGDPINDPAKALSMLSALKEAKHLDLQIKRNGRSSTFSYDIN